MAWLEKTYGAGHKYWTDTDTGEMVYTRPSGEVVTEAPKATWTESKYGDQHTAFTNDKTGEVVYDRDATLTDAERQQQFMDIWNNPSASSWDKALAVQKQYGVETLAQLAGQGHFADLGDNLGRHIAARQAEGESEGFSIGGNQLGLWPVALGTAAFAGLAAAGAEGAGGGAATGSTGGLSTTGFDAANLGAGGATASSPGLTAGGFEAANLGAGGVAASPGIAAPASGLGALSTGSFAAEGLAPALAESSALGGVGAGALGSGAAGASALSAGGGASSFGGGGEGGGASGGGSATGGGGMGGGSWLTSDDEWLRMLMRGAPGLLGALGSASQAEDFEDLAHQYQQMGAPYRSKLQELYGNPQAFLNSPEVRVPIQQGTDMLARSLSVKGNPAGSGNALQELQNYTSNQLFSRLGQEKDRLGGFGGLTQYNQAAPQMAQSALAAQGNIYGDLGGAAADIFNPPRRYNLQDLMRSMG